jgi:hypothetical protein
MNNTDKLKAEIKHYDLTFPQLASMIGCHYSTLSRKLFLNQITDDEYREIIQVCETNEYKQVFKLDKVKCKICGEEYEPPKHNSKYCSENCRDYGKNQAIKKCNKNRKERKKPLKPGESQKLLAKEVVELAKKGLTYGQMSLQREIERIWGKI